MGPRVFAMLVIATLLVPVTGKVFAQPAPAPSGPSLGNVSAAAAVPMRIFTPPPLQWDHPMLSFHPALAQTATDFANLTGGIVFGMSAADLNGRLPDPYPGLAWNGLPTANEYPGEVRYFGVPIERAGPLRMGVTACTGAASYIVFLFNSQGLFRLSYRLIADPAGKTGGCADTAEAARELFARYVPIGQTVALSLRYRSGRTQVVDVTDPTAGFLIPTRWRQSSD